MTAKTLSLQELWQSNPINERPFNSASPEFLPLSAKRYLSHAIAPGTPLASAVRLRMHGDIKLKQWYPFRAEQVINWHRGLIWQAMAWVNCLPVIGSDRLVDGVGMMNWKLLGLFPVVQSAAGADIDRSTWGRLQGEVVWLPSVLARANAFWTAGENSSLRVEFPVLNTRAELTLNVADNGALETFEYSRWGNRDNQGFHLVSFGGIVEEERTFGGYTIPTRLRIGWYFGGDRFEEEGEFFRVTVDDAIYR